MNIFEPEIVQPPFVRVARVPTEAASDPVPGSVSPKQPSHSPEQSFGRSDVFCSSVPHCSIEPATSEVWTETTVRADESPRPISSTTSPYAEVVEPPAAVLLRDGRAEVAHVAELLDELEVEALVAVVVAGAGDDLAVGEIARRLANQALFVGEVEVHPPSRFRAPESSASIRSASNPATRWVTGPGQV